MQEKEILELNKKLKQEFEIYPTEEHLEKYVMSELLPPIEDYDNVLLLIRDNLQIIKTRSLLYLAAEICNSWPIMDNVFIQILEELLENSSDSEKAITYYLLSDYVVWKYGKKDTRVRKYLELSVRYSKNMKFVNNRIYLAEYLDKNQKLEMLEDALSNVEFIYAAPFEDYPLDYWLDSQREINERILGIYISKQSHTALISAIQKLI